MKSNVTKQSLLLVLCLIAVSGTPALAQDEHAQGARPRVGLVLSGGGARGAAHIGVLRYLEEQRIPVDFVVGTSTGALIGGMYASGMSAKEIEQLVLSLDWEEMFSDDARMDELIIRRKLQRYRYLIDFEAGLRDGEIVLPTGLIRGQRMMLMLREQMLPVRHIRDFDELPTPFRTVATDLATARAVIFERGDLVQAMRASMSVPGIYSTVEFHGTRLVDGGLVQNLPVPVAREQGMDVLIAVDVSTPLRDPAELRSPIAVTAQVIDGVMLNQSRMLREQLQDRDVLIQPALEDHTSTDFSAVADISKAGYAQAAGMAEQLAPFRVSPEQYRRYLAQREARRRKEPVIEDVHVDTEPRFENLVQGRVRRQEGEDLNLSQLHGDIVQLYGLGLFESIHYTVGENAHGGEVLVIETEPRQTGLQRFETGLELHENFSGTTAFQLRAAFHRAGVNPLGAEWRTELNLGTFTGLSTEFYQPVSYSGRFFTTAGYTYGIGELPAMTLAGELADYRVRENVLGLDFGVNIGRWTMATIGLRFGDENMDPRNDEASLFGERHFDVGDAVLRFRHDSMNSVTFPSSGWRLDARWEREQSWLGSPGDGEYAALEVLKAFGNGRDNLLLGGVFESALDGERFLAQGVALGGLTRLSGFERDELIGRHAGMLRAIYYRYLGRDSDRFFSLPAYAGVSFEAGNVWADSDAVSSGNLIRGGSLFIALDTFLGPVGLAYGRSADGHDTFYLSIGTIHGPSFRQFRR